MNEKPRHRRSSRSSSSSFVGIIGLAVLALVLLFVAFRNPGGIHSTVQDEVCRKPFSVQLTYDTAGCGWVRPIRIDVRNGDYCFVKQFSFRPLVHNVKTGEIIGDGPFDDKKPYVWSTALGRKAHETRCIKGTRVFVPEAGVHEYYPADLYVEFFKS